MSISQKYTGKTRAESFIKYKRLVIPKIHPGIVGALRAQSLKDKENPPPHDDGSAAARALFYVYKGLRQDGVNVDAIEKSKVYLLPDHH